MNSRTIIVCCLVLIAACGLSFWGGWALRTPDNSTEATTPGESAVTYYCSMHPHITLPHPGKCSICGMDLIPLTEETDERPRTLSMSAAAAQLAEIETADVRRDFVAKNVSMDGKVEFDETKVKTITAWVDGRLDRLYVDYTGVPVAKGDHVADIFSPKLYEAQRQLLEALKSAEDPETSSERLRKSSQGTLEAVRKRMQLLGLSEEQVTEIEQRNTLSDHLLIRSPVRGVVVEKLVNVGEAVTTGTPLYRVVELDTVWVQLNAYESDLVWLRYGQEVSFQTESYRGRVFRGTVSFIDWVVDNRTRTVKVRVKVENSDGALKPGMFVRAEVQATLTDGARVMVPALRGKWISPMHPEVVKEGPGSCDVCGMDLVPAETVFPTIESQAIPPLIIPATAPLLTGRRAVVYVRLPGDKPVFEGREVRLGPRAGEHYVVLEGLAEGDRVVTRGSFKIDSSLQIMARKSMMSSPGGSATRQDTAAIRAVWSDVYEAYVEIVSALAADDASAAATAAQKGLKALDDQKKSDEAAWEEARAELRGALTRLREARELETQRTQLYSVTESLKQSLERYGHASRLEVDEYFCPMAFDDRGASWFQAGGSIANPYFGASMLRCGVKRHTYPIASDSREAPAAVNTAPPEHDHGGHDHGGHRHE